MKPMMKTHLPRLYIFLIIVIALFSTLNILIVFYGRGLFIYFQAIWSWSAILLLSLVGAMLIGMFVSYRILAFREFTPFEKDMMEMRVEVSQLKEMLTQIRDRLDGEGVEEPTEAPTGDDEDTTD
jgi:small-conductance mechanosensitive channel